MEVFGWEVFWLMGGSYFCRRIVEDEGVFVEWKGVSCDGVVSVEEDGGIEELYVDWVGCWGCDKVIIFIYFWLVYEIEVGIVIIFFGSLSIDVSVCWFV